MIQHPEKDRNQKNYRVLFSFLCYICAKLQEYLKAETQFRESNILVGIYLEAEDFEYFRKFRKKVKSLFIGKGPFSPPLLDNGLVHLGCGGVPGVNEAFGGTNKYMVH